MLGSSERQVHYFYRSDISWAIESRRDAGNSQEDCIIITERPEYTKKPKGAQNGKPEESSLGNSDFDGTEYAEK